MQATYQLSITHNSSPLVNCQPFLWLSLGASTHQESYRLYIVLEPPISYPQECAGFERNTSRNRAPSRNLKPLCLQKRPPGLRSYHRRPCRIPRHSKSPPKHSFAAPSSVAICAQEISTLQTNWPDSWEFPTALCEKP